MPSPISFSALKRSRGSIEQLTNAIQQSSQKKREDDRLWECTTDKAKNGHALIRFLPAPPQDGEDGLPWVRTFSHGFQGPGGWLIDLCPTTLEQKCPVCEANSLLWNSGIEANKTTARTRKRKLSYTANILVVSDPAKPENDGKVKLFRFGSKVFNKLYEKMHPEFPDEVAFSPFDLWEGANFKLKIRQVEGYRNYDKSEFTERSPVSEDEAKLEALWKSEYPLLDFVSPGNFKSYAQIAARFTKVLGTAVTAVAANSLVEAALLDGVHDNNKEDSDSEEGTAGGHTEDYEEDENLTFFKRLAEKGDKD